ncbi:IS3 family transposase [Rhodovarius crocodyli]
MRREGFEVAHCTVARLTSELGLQGVIRRKTVCTTISVKASPCLLDHVNHLFHHPAPDRLWLSHVTYGLLPVLWTPG